MWNYWVGRGFSLWIRIQVWFCRLCTRRSGVELGFGSCLLLTEQFHAKPNLIFRKKGEKFNLPPVHGAERSLNFHALPLPLHRPVKPHALLSWAVTPPFRGSYRTRMCASVSEYPLHYGKCDSLSRLAWPSVAVSWVVSGCADHRGRFVVLNSLCIAK